VTDPGWLKRKDEIFPMRFF